MPVCHDAKLSQYDTIACSRMVVIRPLTLSFARTFQCVFFTPPARWAIFMHESRIQTVNTKKALDILLIEGFMHSLPRLTLHQMYWLLYRVGTRIWLERSSCARFSLLRDGCRWYQAALKGEFRPYCCQIVISVIEYYFIEYLGSTRTCFFLCAQKFMYLSSPWERAAPLPATNGYHKH